MSTFLSRFAFDAAKVDGLVWSLMLIIWLLVLGCGIGSVVSNGPQFNRRQRILWISLMVGVPLLGVLAYLPFSQKREGYTLMRQTRKSKQVGGRDESRGNLIQG